MFLLNVRTFETLPPFEPPHFDVVTSLAIVKDTLISGSRDKNLRGWDKQLFTNKQSMDVMSAHSEWINALETDHDNREMYSASKDGIVKVWKIKQKQLKCVASLATPSTASINTICKIDRQFGKMFACGSTDKQLRIWKQRGANGFDLEDNSAEYTNNQNGDYL